MSSTLRKDWIELVTAATSEPISLDVAKEHCRISGADDDQFLTSLIGAARDYCQKSDSGRRQYVNATYDWKLVDFCGHRIVMPRAPLQSVTSITYYDTANTSTVFSSSLYHVATPDDGKGWIEPISGQSWPSVYSRPDAVTIRFVAGYGSAAGNVPETLRQAMLLLIGHWYENREAAMSGSVSKEVEFSVNSLLARNETGSYA